MRTVLLCLALSSAVVLGTASATEPPSSTTFQSAYGFTVQLPRGWVLLGPNEASRKGAQLNAQELGLANADQRELNTYLQRVKTQKVEFYLDALLSNEEFTNNVSVQLEKGSQDYSQYSPAEVSAFCGQLAPDLAKVWGTAVEVKGYQIASSNGAAIFAYSYVIPAQNKFILQYLVPFGANRTMVVVGGGRLDKKVVPRMQAAVKAIVTSITGRAK